MPTPYSWPLESPYVPPVPVGTPPLELHSMDRAAYGSAGGDMMLIDGVFPQGSAVRIYVGALGTSADPQALSGIPGSAPISRNGTELRIFLPKLDPGVYNLFAVAGLTEVLWPNAVTIRKSNYSSGIFSLRSMFSPIMAVGPRTLDQVP
jgi:hypothetical protein